MQVDDGDDDDDDTFCKFRYFMENCAIKSYFGLASTILYFISKMKLN